MDFQLTEEQRLLKETAGTLAAEEFAEDAFTWEGSFPEANQAMLAEQGLLGIALPEAYGGGGYSPLEVLLAQEAVGRVCPDTAHVLSRSSMGPPRVIAALGTDHLKERYLPGVTTGETVMTIAISEPEAGSDAGNMRTTATREGDAIVLDGQKAWVSKAGVADALLVYARFPDGHIGAVVVDTDTDGLSLGEGYVNMAGHRQYDVFLEGCRVPEEQVLSEGKEAFKALLSEFNVERCHNAMMCVACGLNAFDKALAYAKDREQFGQPIAEFQGIEWKLADVAMQLDAARLMIYRAAANARDEAPSRLETSMAKVFANEAGMAAVDEALQIHGATGYMRDHPINYLYRWVRGWKIAGGTVEVQRNAIADQLKKYGLQ